MILPAVPAGLPVKLNRIEYNIQLAHCKGSISNLLKRADFELEPFLDRLGAVVYQAIGDLGVSSALDTGAEKRLTYYVVNYYRDFSIEEIRLAFELAITGELPVNIEHYQSFDIKYICAILTAYRKKRTESFRKYVNVDEFKVKQPTPAEIRRNYIQNIIDRYTDFAQTGKLSFMRYDNAYNFLMDEGIMKVDEQQWLTFLEKARDELVRELKNPANIYQKKQYDALLRKLDKEIYDTHLFHIRKIAKQIAIRTFFTDCLNQGLDLPALLAEIRDRSSPADGEDM